ncbi:hypothetical protein B0A48_18711 [Cryoendolithus antarcticus]|uniref:Uncharacterized protein n=1 Tax=Cryoendolithus antarcticus TaxID=1507870 RepID=A0A1V8S7N2_9PEZI|nr:hypothetical protein B0A48_18711 [Cryoendolithus antarcticus]
MKHRTVRRWAVMSAIPSEGLLIRILITSPILSEQAVSHIDARVPAAIAAIMPAGCGFPRELVRKAKFGELDEAVAIVLKLLIRHRSILVQIERRHARDPAASIHDAVIS